MRRVRKSGVIFYPQRGVVRISAWRVSGGGGGVSGVEGGPGGGG